jgi:hypothetical protein
MLTLIGVEYCVVVSGNVRECVGFLSRCVKMASLDKRADILALAELFVLSWMCVLE